MRGRRARFPAALLPLLALAGCPPIMDEAGPPPPCPLIVRCSDRAPLPGVDVQMFDGTATVVGHATTDAHGVFCLAYDVTDVALSKPGFRTLVSTVADLSTHDCLTELACTPGAPTACPCPDGGTGQAACLDGGAALGPCMECPP